MLTAFIALWAAFGFECALVAYVKGRNPLAWFGLGELFGPFALVIVLGLGMVEKSGVTKKCLFCTKIIRYKATTCKHCGRAQQAGDGARPTDQPEAPPQPQPRTWKQSKGRTCILCRHYQLFKCKKDGLDLKKIEINAVGCTLFNT